MLVEGRKNASINSAPKVVSLFTCGMGMDLGFEQAGFQVVYTNDIVKFACDTIRRNRPSVHCDEGDITLIKTKDILSRSGLQGGDVDVVIGGPPCQSFSTAGMRRGLDDKRGMALLEFIRVIRETRPKFFVFENVAGLKSAAKKHVSFYERVKNGKSLGKDHELGSLFKEILEQFKVPGYKFEWRILNAADFGVPQKRKRLILIGSRVADPSAVFDELMKHARWCDPKKAEKEGKMPWRTLRDALHDLDDQEKEHVNFSRDVTRYLKYVPPGGCWINIPKKMQRDAMGGAADDSHPDRKGKQGGRRGFYRRLEWDKPAPTLVTSPSQLGTCLCHPDETRPLSVREYARIQGFPDSWEFVGTTSQKYRMIGEAVPVDLARAIGKSIMKFLSSY
jgi:DNA (cytosine-5)-methyltransferase 1